MVRQPGHGAAAWRYRWLLISAFMLTGLTGPTGPTASRQAKLHRHMIHRSTTSVSDDEDVLRLIDWLVYRDRRRRKNPDWFWFNNTFCPLDQRF